MKLVELPDWRRLFLHRPGDAHNVGNFNRRDFRGRRLITSDVNNIHIV
jgi:hypothetical protein